MHSDWIKVYWCAPVHILSFQHVMLIHTGEVNGVAFG